VKDFDRQDVPRSRSRLVEMPALLSFDTDAVTYGLSWSIDMATKAAIDVLMSLRMLHFS
jgi:hypothetical protein